MFNIGTAMLGDLAQKRILLGVTGGIAIYKSIELVRRLVDLGAKVRVVMTDAAKAFVTPLTFQVVSGAKVRGSLFDEEAEAAMGHIELARWADMIVIAPASANTLAQLTHGLASDLLSTVCLASNAPMYVCPAMNMHMWSHPATQENISRLKQRGVQFIGPEEGQQVCGDNGPGRMSEVAQILLALEEAIGFSPALQGCRVLITAGPTQEALDPVRYITNHSSGKMGYALANAASQAGADVTLISGPTALTAPSSVRCIDVVSAGEMLSAVKQALAETDIFIGTAAVCDYFCVDIASEKIKKKADSLTLQLTQTPDVLRFVTHQEKPPFAVGFAAETTALKVHALKKLQQKKCDMVIGNQVGGAELGFNSDENAVTVFTKKGEKTFEKEHKQTLATKLIQYIASHYHKEDSHGA